LTTKEYRYLVSHLECPVCGGPFPMSFPSGQPRCKSHGIPKACSKSCFGKLIYSKSRRNGFGVFLGDKRPESAIMRRERHGQWRGGVSPDAMLERVTIEYKEWRTAVYDRDDYTCQSCGARGVRLNAHHIRSFAQYPQFRTDIENGVTLCVECHKAAHRG